jgi:hypothetical protein
MLIIDLLLSRTINHSFSLERFFLSVNDYLLPVTKTNASDKKLSNDIKIE